MWLFLWVVFVLSALGFFLWSYHTTYEQKKVWKSFANQFGLRYAGGRMMDPPAMAGIVKDREINCYSQMTETEQGQKVVQTVIEVFFNKRPDTVALVASRNFIDFVAQVDFPDPFIIEDDRWPRELLSRTNADATPELWFMHDIRRIEAIRKLASLPFDFVFFCDPQDAFIAIRTVNPLSETKQINKVLNALYECARILEDDSKPLEAQDVPPEEIADNNRPEPPQDEEVASTTTNPKEDSETTPSSETDESKA